MKKTFLCGVVVLLAAVFSGMGGRAESSCHVENPAALLARAAQKGRRVLVGVQASLFPKDAWLPSQVLLQRGGIAVAQDQVLSRLATLEAQNSAIRFQTTLTSRSGSTGMLWSVCSKTPRCVRCRKTASPRPICKTACP